KGRSLHRVAWAPSSNGGWVVEGVRAANQVLLCRRAKTAIGVTALGLVALLTALAWAVSSRATYDLSRLASELETIRAGPAPRPPRPPPPPGGHPRRGRPQPLAPAPRSAHHASPPLHRRCRTRAADAGRRPARPPGILHRPRQDARGVPSGSDRRART